MEPARRDDGQPIFNIVGEKVALGPLRRELLPLYHRWGNDFEANVRLGHLAPSTLEGTEAWYARAGEPDGGEITFTIYERAGPRPIGTTNLHFINRSHRRAQFGIAIGEKECWGKGYGTEATRLMLDYGFTALGLETIMLWVASYHERAIRAYARAGFRECGRWRQAWRLGDRAHDVLMMDCTASKFQSPALARPLPKKSA